MDRTFFKLFKDGQTILQEAGIEDTSENCEILLLKSFNIPKAKFLAELHTNLLKLYSQKKYKQNYDKFKKYLKLRCKRTPIAYILGETGFRNNLYKVAKKVFIPRPETELLVEKAIEIGNSLEAEEKEFVIFDVGCGTGIIGLELALAFPKNKVFLWEKSKKAYMIAEKNKENLDVKNAEIYHKDFFADKTAWEKIIKEKYILLVSNPPYISRDDIKKLGPEIQFEPRLAQDGGIFGLKVYKKLFKNLKDLKGFLVLEIGQGQEVVLKEILRREGYNNYNFKPDWQEILRILVINKTEAGLMI
jgi:release factor glutamine methyltransferase